MATAGHQKASRQTFKDDDAFPVLKQYFSPDVQRQLINEDRIAWRNITSILFSLVTTGLILGIVAVLAILLL